MPTQTPNNPINECIAKGLYWVESIYCPECGKKQQARVYLTQPWPVYVHVCDFCQYIITESEWDQVDPFIYLKPKKMNFFSQMWSRGETRLLIAFLLGGTLVWSIAWSIQDQALNLTPLWISLWFSVFLIVITFIAWLVKKNKEGGTHG